MLLPVLILLLSVVKLSFPVALPKPLILPSSFPVLVQKISYPGGTLASTNASLLVPGVTTTTSLVSGIVNSAAHVASGANIATVGGEALAPGGATEATNSTVLVPSAGACEKFLSWWYI
jgi:hypothetical protein